MVSMFELLKGQIDVSKYEEEQKLQEQLKKLDRELDILNGKIFSNKLAALFGEYDSKIDKQLQTDCKNKQQEITEFKNKHKL